MSTPADRPDTERLLDLVDAMSGQPVLMLADLVADRFISGTPKRISREAPVLILRHESDAFVPGGGANAIMNVAALGGRPLAVGAVGDDDSGSRLVDALAERGIATEGIEVVPGYQTPTKTRILGGGPHSIKQQIVRYDIEDRLSPDASAHAAFGRSVERWGSQARVAVLSDYGYGAVLPERVPEIRGALGDSAEILCDSRYRLDDFEGIDGATPNEEEAVALVAREGGGSVDLDRQGESLRRLMRLRFLLITRGSYGMSLFVDGASCHIPVHGTAEVADVTGAGDTVIGAFSLAVAAGASPVEAALLANYAGGIVVAKAGTATTSAEELRQAVRADPRPLEECRWARS